MNIVSNCPLCDEHSLHILGKDETQTQQCINCGYVTAEKFKLNGVKKEEHKEYKTLTDDMKRWTKESNERLWIPTIMTLPIGMLYPQNVDNMVNHKTEMKWHFAEMKEIQEHEKEQFLDTLQIEIDSLKKEVKKLLNIILQKENIKRVLQMFPQDSFLFQ